MPALDCSRYIYIVHGSVLNVTRGTFRKKQIAGRYYAGFYATWLQVQLNLTINISMS